MPHHPHRRTLLLGAAGFALTALTYRAKAQSEVVQGRLIFAGDAKIPKGRITIFLSSLGQPGTSDPALEFDLISTGRAKRIDFTLSSAALSALSPTLQVVARLERADGWLIARGSTKLPEQAPRSISPSTR
ncbi:hypothetical protein L0Z64_05705 [Phaeobacter sp. BS23]|uniref:hypothetical protein n=1 Tax=Phaeobacter sp. BS23 TaxID=2907239 RepID=UPI00386C87EC